MNATPPDTRRQKQSALTAMVGASLALGIVDAALSLPSAENGPRLAVTLLGNVALLLLGFRWLTVDARELDIRRPTWLNVGIILLAAVFVPYYLYKTRPAGHRARAILAFVGLVFGCMFASAIGALLYGVVAGTAPAP